MIVASTQDVYKNKTAEYNDTYLLLKNLQLILSFFKSSIIFNDQLILENK